jgi:CarboxypepD_reg-like domain
MIEKRLVWVLLLISQIAFSQTKGVVKDSLTGKPIPYVNIWVENENIGTTSEENGTFEIKTSKDKQLLFSTIGYHSKKAVLNSKNEVLLLQKNIELENVDVIKLKKSETLLVGNSVFRRITHLQGKYPQILAKRFDYDSIYKKTPYLKEIEVFTQSEIKEATLKLRILLHDELTDLPIIDLVNEDIIVKVKRGRNKTKIDVSKHKIKFPKQGIAIGLESMVIESNKYTYSYKYNGINYDSEVYAPAIICNNSEEEKSYLFLNIKWMKRKPSYNEKEEKYLVLEPAINIILTN